MSKRVVAGIMTVGLLGGGGFAVVKGPELIGEKVPSVPSKIFFLDALGPQTELQPLTHGSSESLICAADTERCTAQTALAAFAINSHHVNLTLDKLRPDINQPSNFEKAVIATEDRRFRVNKGCDTESALAAAVATGAGKLLNTGERRGGSTLVRELISNTREPATDYELQHNEQVNVRRAYQLFGNDVAQQVYECSAALKLYQDYVAKYKTEDMAQAMILLDFANAVKFGRKRTGLEEASESDFGIHAKQMSMVQAMIEAAKLTEPNNVDINIYAKSIRPTIAANYEDFVAGVKGQPQPGWKFWDHLPVLPDHRKPPTYEDIKAALLKAHDEGMPDKQFDKLLTYAVFQKELHGLNNNYLHVVKANLEAGNITPAEAEEDRKAFSGGSIPLLPYKDKPGADHKTDTTVADKLGARYYIDDVEKELADLYASGKINISKDDLIGGGYIIQTTLNTKSQAVMNAEISRERPLRDQDLDIGAMKIRYDGAVEADYGGSNYKRSEFSMATDARTDDGSQNKPFILAAAMEKGVRLNDVVHVKHSETFDIPTGKGNTVPLKVDTGWGCDRLVPARRVPCDMTERQGTGASSNPVGAHNLRIAGLPRVVAIMNGLGAKLPDDVTPSMVLGTTISVADTALGINNLINNQGSYVPRYSVTRIFRSDGSTLYEHQAAVPTPLKTPLAPRFTRKVAKATNYVVNHGTAAGIFDAPNGPRSIGAKTGTGNANNTYGAEVDMCDPKFGDHAYAIRVAHRSRNYPIPASEYSASRDMAAIIARIIRNSPSAHQPCSISSDLVGQR